MDTKSDQERRRAQWQATARPSVKGEELASGNPTRALTLGFLGIGLLIVVVFAVFVGWMFAGDDDEPRQTALQAAAEDCDDLSDHLHYNAQRDSISVSGDAAGDIAAVSCLLEATSAPERVWQDIQQTTAMQGNRSETWRGITGSWNYHPDRGIDFIMSH